jgi:hypothetical protein
MIRAMQVPLLLCPTIRNLAVAAHGLSRLPHLTRPWVGLALTGLVVGILVHSLPSAWSSPPSPDVLRTVTRETMRPPQDPAFGWDASPSLSPLEAHRAVLSEPPGLLPHGRLALDGCDLEDDHLASTAVTTQGSLFLPSPRASTGVNHVQHAFPWPFRWLVRPQRLTHA